jgi:hypothetical protein
MAFERIRYIGVASGTSGSPALNSDGVHALSFERIGPYDLTRSDLLAASLVISFRLGTWKVKLWAVLITVLGLALGLEGFLLGDRILTAAPLAASFLIFWPALRSLKGSKGIYLSYEEDGLIADTPAARTVYKWVRIGKATRVGSRLYIMVSSRTALVLAARMTSPANLDALQSTVAEHLAPGPKK